MFNEKYDKLYQEALADIYCIVEEKGENGVIYTRDADTMKKLVIISDDNDENNSYILKRLENKDNETILYIENAFDETSIAARALDVDVLCGLADYLNEYF